MKGGGDLLDGDDDDDEDDTDDEDLKSDAVYSMDMPVRSYHMKLYWDVS